MTTRTRFNVMELSIGLIHQKVRWNPQSLRVITYIQFPSYLCSMFTIFFPDEAPLADPGSPRWARTNPKGGDAKLLFWPFSPINCRKFKKLGREGGAHPQSPLNPPMAVPSNKPTTWVREIVKVVDLGPVKDPVWAGRRISSGGRGRTPRASPAARSASLCSPLAGYSVAFSIPRSWKIAVKYKLRTGSS